MAIPGASDPSLDPEVLDRAEEQSEKLLEELKGKIKTEIREVGALRKELLVTVPGGVIEDRLAHDFDELRHDATVPGFRKGHAPPQLIEKRFAPDVRNNLKTSMIGQSFFAAIENEGLDVLGDPLFRVETDEGVQLLDMEQALEHMIFPESGDFSYTCEVEVKPTFELPELKGIEIEVPKAVVTDELVDEYILRQRQIRGRYEPTDEGASESDDVVIADVRLSVEGQMITEEENVELGVRPTRLEGIPLMTLGETLKGAKADDERSAECEIPDDYARPDLRGKQCKFEFKIHEVKRLAPQPIEAYAESMGLDSEQEVRDLVRDDMEVEGNIIVRQVRKQAIRDYLLEKVTIDLPEHLSARQTDRAVARRVVELQQAGVPKGEIDARIDELRTSAKQEVGRNLKLDFIMDKIAEKLEVEATDEDVNSYIATMARLYNQRFDRVRDDLVQRGLFAQIGEQIRQDRCIDQILADAKITEIGPEPDKETEPKAAE